MRARTVSPIPRKISVGIGKTARSERELQRQEQLAAILSAAGSWKDEDHPELAKGSEAFVRELRNEASKRLERLHQEASQ